jgi:Uma2 family endonuclease
MIWTRPQSRFHGRFQAQITRLVHQYLPAGEVLITCPVSTDDGVRAADVVWLSPQRSQETAGQAFLRIAPEICIEVLSPSNTPEQMNDKAALYFSAGAQEVWWCQEDGTMRFFTGVGIEVGASGICPGFPKKIAG